MRDLVLRYETVQDQVCLTVQEHQAGQWSYGGRYSSGCSFREVEGLSGQMHGLLGETVWVAATDSPSSQELANRLQQLREQGIQLRKFLIPEEVRKRIEDLTDIHHLVFQCPEHFSGVPLEWMVLGQEFLAYQYPVGKQVLRASAGANPGIPAGPVEQVPYRVFSVVDPDQLLETAGAMRLRQCWERFRQQWASAKGDGSGGKISPEKMIDFTDVRAFRPVRKERLLEALRQKEIVLLIGHYLARSLQEGPSGFVLGQQREESGLRYKMFTPQDLLQALQGSGKVPLLLVAIACESARSNGLGDGESDLLSSMAAASLQAGIAHYVGAAVRVPADYSAQFLQPFFAALREGYSFGQALRAARIAFRTQPADPLDPGTALGLSFLGYGDPTIGYFCSNGHRIFHLSQHRCARLMDSGRVCGRIICPEEPEGFARFRCRLHLADKQRCSAGHEQNPTQFRSCKKCENLVCPECPGWGRQLCWEHMCYEGHEILDLDQKKICSDPFACHPGERRAVCPKDSGWLRGLCRECLSKRPESCPHCASFIQPGNPWTEVRCAICGRLHCSRCLSWYLATGACRKTGDPLGQREWLEVLRERSLEDSQLASLGRLEEAARWASQWQELVGTNLRYGVDRNLPLPRLSQPFWSFFLPDPPCWGGIRLAVADLGPQLAQRLAHRWNLHLLDPPWQPPCSWQEAYGLRSQPPTTANSQVARSPSGVSANQLLVHRIRGLWGKAVLVAVAAITPVEFQSGRGPVLLPAHKAHLEDVEQVLTDWWQGTHPSRELPDRYLVVFSTTGWGRPDTGGWADSCATLAPGRLTIAAQPLGHSFHIAFPPVAGLPHRIENFLSLFSPQMRSELLARICQRIEQALQTESFVTAGDIQERLEFEWQQPVDSRMVLDAFRRLARTGRYKIFWEKDPRVQKTSAAEQIGRLLSQRRWQNRICWTVSTVATFLWGIESLGAWLVKIFGLPDAFAHQFVWGGIAVGAQMVNLLLKIRSNWEESANFS